MSKLVLYIWLVKLQQTGKATNQRNRFLALLLAKIQKACQIHSQRALSIRGRVAILNSLILAKLWHVLQLTTVPKQFLCQV
jgi:hypothetical protein